MDAQQDTGSETPNPHGRKQNLRWGEQYQRLRNIPSFLRIVWETNPMLSTGAIAVRLVTAFLPIANLAVSRSLINLVVKALHSRRIDQEALWQIIVIGLLVMAFSDLLFRATRFIDSLLGDQVAHTIAVQMVGHAKTLDYSEFEQPSFHDHLERARKQASGRISLLASIAAIARQLLTLATMLITIVIISPWLILLVAVATIPSFWIETRHSRLQYSMLFRQTSARRQISYLESICLSTGSIKEAKVFGFFDHIIERINELFQRLYVENRDHARKQFILGAVSSMIPTAAYWAAYAMIVLRAFLMRATIGDVTMAAGAFTKAHDLIENIVSQFADTVEQCLYLEDLFIYLGTKPRTNNISASERYPSATIKNGLVFKHVQFQYPGQSAPTLVDISFQLAPGMVLAIVGANGAGKTTLVKLLCGLYTPTRGSIVLDGADVRDDRSDGLRSLCSVVFQDYARYDLTVRENIGLGDTQRMGEALLVEAAACASRAAETIGRLPGGYDQMLGTRFDGAMNVSGGQWQRIALARAYIRDSPILILDEPGANLDSAAEADLFNTVVRQRSQDRIIVLISHKLSTVRHADHILVLENGKVREEGRHGQLLQLGGKYAEMFERQAAAYR